MIILKVEVFSQKQNLNFFERQAFASFKHGFFQVWGKHFPQTWKKPCLKLAKACLSTKFKFCFWENHSTYKNIFVVSKLPLVLLFLSISLCFPVWKTLNSPFPDNVKLDYNFRHKCVLIMKQAMEITIAIQYNPRLIHYERYTIHAV